MLVSSQPGERTRVAWTMPRGQSIPRNGCLAYLFVGMPAYPFWDISLALSVSPTHSFMTLASARLDVIVPVWIHDSAGLSPLQPVLMPQGFLLLLL